MDDLPAFGSFNANSAQADLTSRVGQLAPLVTSYSGPQTGSFAASTPYKAPADTRGNFQKFVGFFGTVGKDIGHIAGGAEQWLYHNVVNMTEAPPKLGAGLAHGLSDRQSLGAIDQQLNDLSARTDQLHKDFAAGLITSKQYQDQLKEYAQESDNLVRSSKAVNDRLGSDYQQTKQALISTSADLVTILTMGFGKAPVTNVSLTGLTPVEARTAGDFLMSQASKPFMAPVESLVGRAFTNPDSLKYLGESAQQFLSHATAEVVSTGAKMTAAQTARAVAANVALKYPLTFSFANPTAAQFYNSLDNQKYGDAVRALGYAFGIIAAGGAIPYALKFGGKALSGLSARTFGQSSFWDELGKYYSEGHSAAFYSAVNKVVGAMAPAERNQALKNLSALEQTNMAAVGHDAIAAARRVSDGQAAAYGFSTKEMSAEEEVQRMIGFAKWQRVADGLGQRIGKQYTVVRADPKNINDISATIAQTTNKQEALDAWNGWKAAHAQLAEANNSGLDRQVKSIIARNEDATTRAEAVRGIKATSEVSGIPKAIKRQMAKDGYIVAQPKTVEAPFKEGTGVLKSSSAKEGDVWVKTVAPVPVLGQLGKMLTGMGLSPQNSVNRVYQMFNDQLTKNLEDAKVVTKLVGDTQEQSTDRLIKQLSSYMYSPTRTDINRIPISDLRQLTVKDIAAATDKSLAESKLIQEAIAKAHLQVPFAVKGLGDRAVDVLIYGAKPVATVGRRYLRLQGALRFAFNPFFQYLRLIPKNEILTESQGGGFLKSMFTGRIGELRAVRQGLHEAGFFSRTGGYGNVMSGEAADFAGVAVKGISKRLLPMQERSLAGLISVKAERMGMSWQQYISSHPDEVHDIIEGIVSYSPKAGFINSPLMRTLNIAFFPARFEVKVATYLAKGLANTGLLTRTAFVVGLMRAHDWFQSPEGKAWYQQNSEVIGLFNYITPLHSFNEIFHSLLPGNDHSLGNFGELGGLPFGWIPQLLDAEGLTHFNQPGVDAKTGQVFSQKIPITARGQVATAIQDLIGGLFSYPGTLAGLPSKTKATHDIARSVTGANDKTDFRTVNPDNSPPQELPVFNHAQPSIVPAQPTPITQPKVKAGGGTKKLKKAQFTPQLLPGQSTLGQL